MPEVRHCRFFMQNKKCLELDTINTINSSLVLNFFGRYKLGLTDFESKSSMIDFD